MAVDIRSGSHLPVYATALGRVLPAQLPVNQCTKALRAAGNVAAHADRDAAQDITAPVLPFIRSAAQAIHQDLAIVGPFHRLSPL